MFKKGFTLIELLVVVSVIAILSGIILSVINVGRTRARAQDAVRRQDVSSIAGALERYYSDNNAYPVSSSYANVSSGVLSALATNYIRVLPSDPVSSQSYQYQSTGQNYCVCFTSTVETTNVLPTGCADPSSSVINVCITNSF